MSPVEFWWRKVGMLGEKVSIEKAFSQPSRYPARKAVILVESQDEHDYCWAMQLVMGCEVTIVLAPGANPTEALGEFSWVFTTWDPTDRNRI